MPYHDWDDAPRRLTRREWDQQHRNTTADLFDLIADTAPDLQSEALARWQAALFRWGAEHS